MQNFREKIAGSWAVLYEIYNMMNMNSHYTYIDIYVFIHKIYTEEGLVGKNVKINKTKTLIDN